MKLVTKTIFETKTICETIFVGIYSIIIATTVISFQLDIISFLFITGFTKHFIGYIIGLHSFFCNKKCSRTINTLIIESIIEGLLFLIFGYIFYTNNIIRTIFYTSVFLHICGELFNIHTFFCKNNCSVIN